MKILLTNDDGITAPGIAALYNAIRSLGEVVVIAPAGVQSAMSHGITFHRPLMTRDFQVNAEMFGGGGIARAEREKSEGLAEGARQRKPAR